jgi:hypothetical protein
MPRMPVDLPAKVDAAIVFATPEPGGAVLTGDLRDVRVLALHTGGVEVDRAETIHPLST